jgi:hypothetical protein
VWLELHRYLPGPWSGPSPLAPNTVAARREVAEVAATMVEPAQGAALLSAKGTGQ